MIPSPDAHDVARHDSTDSTDDEVLRRYGYQPAYQRTLSSFASFATAFSFISIATGIFTGYGIVLNSAGPIGIWTWLIAGVGQIAVALVFASLASRIPLSGYSYQWGSRLANPTVGWFLGWISFAYLAIVVIAVDVAPASLVLPAIFGYEPTTTTTIIGTLSILFIQAVIIALSTRATTLINNSAVSVEVISTVLLGAALVVVALITGKGHVSNLFSRGIISDSPTYFSLFPVGGFFSSILMGTYSIVGFESAANLAEETHKPHIVVPKAMLAAVVGAVALGFLFLVSLTIVIPDIKAVSESATPVADIMQGTLGNVVGNFFLVFVGLAMFACGLICFITGVRLVWSMSRDRRFPGAGLFAKINPTTKTPVWATALFVVLGIPLTLFIDKLTDLLGAASILPALLYAGTVIMYLCTRSHLNRFDETEDETQRQERFSLGAWENPAIVVSLCWLALELWILMDPQFRNAQYYVLGMLGVGVLFYLSMRIFTPAVLTTVPTTNPDEVI